MEPDVYSGPQAEKSAGSPGSLALMFGVFVSPGKVFRTIVDRKHAWAGPAVLLCIVAVLGVVASLGIIREELAETIPAPLIGSSELYSLEVAAVILLLLFLPVALVVAGMIVPAGVYIFFGNFVQGGEARFRQVLAVAGYAILPLILGAVLRVMLAAGLNFPEFSFSPDTLLGEGLRRSFLGMWLGIINPFLIWHLALTALGLSILYGCSKLRIAAWLVPLFLVFHTLVVLLASLSEKLTAQWGL